MLAESLNTRLPLDLEDGHLPAAPIYSVIFDMRSPDPHIPLNTSAGRWLVGRAGP
jgi:hypothetical protein